MCALFVDRYVVGGEERACIAAPSTPFYDGHENHRARSAYGPQEAIILVVFKEPEMDMAPGKRCGRMGRTPMRSPCPSCGKSGGPLLPRHERSGFERLLVC